MKWKNSSVRKLSQCILLLFFLVGGGGGVERVILHCQCCSMRMELLTDSHNLSVIQYRGFKIPSKQQLPSLLGILNDKSDFVQLMQKMLPLVHKKTLPDQPVACTISLICSGMSCIAGF